MRDGKSLKAPLGQPQEHFDLPDESLTSGLPLSEGPSPSGSHVLSQVQALPIMSSSVRAGLISVVLLSGAGREEVPRDKA